MGEKTKDPLLARQSQLQTNDVVRYGKRRGRTRFEIKPLASEEREKKAKRKREYRATYLQQVRLCVGLADLFIPKPIFCDSGISC